MRQYFLKKTSTYDQFEAARTNSLLSSSNDLFDSSVQTYSSSICGSINHDKILTNKAAFIDDEDISSLSSKIVPKNTIE